MNTILNKVNKILHIHTQTNTCMHAQLQPSIQCSWAQPHGESMSESLQNHSKGSSLNWIKKSVFCYADKNPLSFLFISQTQHKSKDICLELSKKQWIDPQTSCLVPLVEVRGDGCVSVCPLSVCFALEMLGTFSAGVAVAGWCCHSNLWGLWVCPAAEPQPVFVSGLTHSSLSTGLCVLVNLFGPLYVVSFQILCSSGGWRQHCLNNAVFSVQSWPLLKASASLMWLTHPPLFTGGLQEFEWTAIRSHMSLLMEVSICV